MKNNFIRNSSKNFDMANLNLRHLPNGPSHSWEVAALLELDGETLRHQAAQSLQTTRSSTHLPAVWALGLVLHPAGPSTDPTAAGVWEALRCGNSNNSQALPMPLVHRPGWL